MKKRLIGYQTALTEAGISPRDEYLAQGEHGRAEARALAANLLRLPDPPTAIFAASDIQAIGVLDAAQDFGLRVPQDLSVIGYDGIRDAEYVGLTTMHQPLFESGVIGVEVLLSLLEGGAADTREVLLPVNLALRRTTGPPRRANHLPSGGDFPGDK